MDIKGAIFDMDGTLLDSMEIWETLGERYLAQFGKTAEPDCRDRLRPLSTRQAAEYFQATYGLTLPAEAIMAGINDCVTRFYFQEAMPKAGVPAFLQKLQSEGVRMAVATATDRPLVEAALTRTGLLPYFDRIFTCSEVGGVGKTQPDIFYAALDFLGTPKAQTWVFEDAIHAAETAKAAGFPLCCVEEASMARWAAELEALADVYIHSFRQLL